jgi:SpoU rRNA methylase family enzyme
VPGKLDPVSQSFSADTSGYISGLEAAITANIAFIDSIDDVIRKSGELGAALKSIPDVKRIAVEVTGLDAAIGKVEDLKAAIEGLDGKIAAVGTTGGGGGSGRRLSDP